MKTPHLLLIAVAVTAGTALAGDLPGLGTKKRAGRQQPREFVHGEISALEERSFSIRPWDPDLPKRLLVLPTPTTEYRRQERCDLKDLKPGDLVGLVEEPRDYPRLPAPRDETPEERKVREARELALRADVDAQPARLRAVFQLWPGATGAAGETTAPRREPEGARPSPAAGEEPEPEVPEKGGEGKATRRGGPVVRSLIAGAGGYFRGRSRGGTDRPDQKTPVRIGTLKTLNPPTAQVGDRELTFRMQRETVCLRHPAIQPEGLKKGKTVLVLGAAPPGADATVQALLVVVTPEPLRSGTQQKKLLQRDRG